MNFQGAFQWLDKSQVASYGLSLIQILDALPEFARLDQNLLKQSVQLL